MYSLKWYFTCIGNTQYLITVPNMNTINPFFPRISQQIHKMFEKVAILTLIWHRVKCYFTSMSNALAPDNCTKYEQNHHILLQDITTNTQNVWKNSHNYSNLTQSQIVFYVHQRPMVPDHGTQYQKNSSSHHEGMREDVSTDGRTESWTLSYMPLFHLGAAGNTNLNLYQAVGMYWAVQPCIGMFKPLVSGSSYSNHLLEVWIGYITYMSL